MITEADVVNGVPQAGGWFVVNASDAPWFHNELGGYCGFEGQDAAFDDLGINLNMLLPGKPMAMYHEDRAGGISRAARRVPADRRR